MHALFLEIVGLGSCIHNLRTRTQEPDNTYTSTHFNALRRASLFHTLQFLLPQTYTYSRACLTSVPRDKTQDGAIRQWLLPSAGQPVCAQLAHPARATPEFQSLSPHTALPLCAGPTRSN